MWPRVSDHWARPAKEATWRPASLASRIRQCTLHRKEDSLNPRTSWCLCKCSATRVDRSGSFTDVRIALDLYYRLFKSFFPSSCSWQIKFTQKGCGPIPLLLNRFREDSAGMWNFRTIYGGYGNLSPRSGETNIYSIICHLPDPPCFSMVTTIKVHKNENLFGSDFEFCTISLY